MSSTPTYKGGIPALLAQYEGRRDSFGYAPGEGLPTVDLDLTPLRDQIITDPAEDAAHAPPFQSSWHRKRFALRQEFTGLSELCYLNAALIAHLRKREFPDHAPLLFNRLWAEQGDHLIGQLNQRWLVSAVTTFGDHGLTPPQRATGLALTALFGAMKLYETERLYSGFKPDTPYPLDRKIRGKLPLEMDAYSLTGGGLDVNLIARLWEEADGDDTIALLAHHLLTLLIYDDRTLFRRLMTMRGRKLRSEQPKEVKTNIALVPPERQSLTPDTLRWGLVSTIKAPLRQIARFAAHHLELGAHIIHIYLDDPNPEAEAFLTRHPRIQITQCDAEYWAEAGKNRMDAHQLRQAHNATRSLRSLADTLDWLGHIDVDEFLRADAPVAEILADVAPSNAMARIPPAEALATDDGLPRHFKLTHKTVGLKKALLQDIYPTFGMHLYGGFLSHTSGKVFARTGIDDTRLGIHAMKYKGEDVSNRCRPDGLMLLHMHAPSWAHFKAHLGFRQTMGSYRLRSERPELGQAELLKFLTEEEGEDGLRAFFDEVCADTPDLRDRLAAHNMLVCQDLDLDGAVARVFGEVPE